MYTVGSIVVVKASFDAWYEKYVQAKIRITLAEEHSLLELRQEFPELYWLTITKI